MSVLLEARDVSVRRNGRVILHPASLRLAEGDFVVIAGPNGSGKSTLLRALSGVWALDSGQVLLEGQPLSSYSRKAIARTVSYVPQDTRMDFGFTVREIVAMGRHPHIARFAAESPKDRDAVERGMAVCDIIHLRERTVNTLSGGERQRVLIARCLAAEPRCILLDEPTASLDLQHALEIFALARRLAADGCAVAMATHDLNSGLRFGQSVLLLSKGKLVYQGGGEAGVPEDTLETVFGVRTQRLQDDSGETHYLFHQR